jgi:hypothetical protein
VWKSIRLLKKLGLKPHYLKIDSPARRRSGFDNVIIGWSFNLWCYMYLTYVGDEVEYFGVSEISIFKGKYKFTETDIIPLLILKRIENLKSSTKR